MSNKPPISEPVQILPSSEPVQILPLSEPVHILPLSEPVHILPLSEPVHILPLISEPILKDQFFDIWNSVMLQSVIKMEVSMPFMKYDQILTSVKSNENLAESVVYKQLNHRSYFNNGRFYTGGNLYPFPYIRTSWGVTMPHFDLKIVSNNKIQSIYKEDGMEIKGVFTSTTNNPYIIPKPDENIRITYSDNGVSYEQI
jgi:hypothetical protein